MLLYLCYLVFYLLFLQLFTVKWGNIEQLPMFFLSKTENQTGVSAYPWTCWEKLLFDQSFLSEHQIFLFENFCLSKKRRSKVMGAFRKLGVGAGWGAETFSDWFKKQTPCEMAVIATNQWLSMSPRCSMSPHLTIL